MLSHLLLLIVVYQTEVVLIFSVLWQHCFILFLTGICPHLRECERQYNEASADVEIGRCMFDKLAMQCTQTNRVAIKIIAKYCKMKTIERITTKCAANQKLLLSFRSQISILFINENGRRKSMKLKILLSHHAARNKVQECDLSLT